MIGAVLGKLCDYSDELYSQGEMQERSIVQKCISIIHECWRESESHKELVVDKKPADIYEEWVLTIPGIEVYEDPTDDTCFYELDGSHFDSAKEVWNYMIELKLSQEKKAKIALAKIRELNKDIQMYLKAKEKK